MPATRMRRSPSPSSGSTSSGEKKKRCPRTGRSTISLPGSSSTETARRMRSSKSCSIFSTIATFPESAMSKMSLPARGHRRTRLPVLTSTPPTVTLRGAGLSRPSTSNGSIWARVASPNRASRRAGSSGLPPMSDSLRSRISRARGSVARASSLLLVREAEDAQREQLVYLPPSKRSPGLSGAIFG